MGPEAQRARVGSGLKQPGHDFRFVPSAGWSATRRHCSNGGTPAPRAATVAGVLFGKVDPGGKLPMSFPRDVGQIPISYNELPAGRPFDPDSNYTSKYLDVANTPQYPFGYGLSCTTFALSNLHLSASSVSTAGTLTVTADLTSTGSRAGDDVAQLRIHESGTSILQPVRRLDGFQRVTLTPGQTQTVTFTLGHANLGFYNNQASSPSNLAASTCTSATVHRPACTTSSPCADRSASVQ